MIIKYILTLTLFFFLFISCDKQRGSSNEILASDDVRIGQIIDIELFKYADSTETFNILDKFEYSELYNYSDSIIYLLLNTGQFKYTSEFNWKIRVFDAPGIESSFALPGGFFYISRDLIKLLDNESQFASIISHVMNVSDSRYITEKLKERFTSTYLLDIALGGTVVRSSDLLDEIIYGDFNNTDSESLENLTSDCICKTSYDIREFAMFLSKVFDNSSDFEWINKYPSKESRLDYLLNQFDVDNCGGTIINQTDFEKIKLTF